jgi:hypothetical protein
MDYPFTSLGAWRATGRMRLKHRDRPVQATLQYSITPSLRAAGFEDEDDDEDENEA